MIFQNTTILFKELEDEMIEMRNIDSTDERDTLMMETAFICLGKQPGSIYKERIHVTMKR